MDAEIADPFPGGDLGPVGERGATMAVTIEAVPSKYGRGSSKWAGTAAAGIPGTFSTTRVALAPGRSTGSGRTSPSASG